MAARKAIQIIFAISVASISVIESARIPKVVDVVDTPLLASQFPSDFAWGTSTSAFQVEGAWNSSGKGVGSWDLWSFVPGHIDDNSTAEVANDYYHKFQEDIQLLEDTGFKAYRFSISWTRMIPAGEGEVSQAGIDFYNRVLDALEEKGIEPYVTLHHFDVPQALEDKYTSWLNESMVNVFTEYADVCFANFGNRVKKWITINEMAAQSGGGWGSDGHFPPGRCSNRSLCDAGNSGEEPYIVVHNMLLAHASAVEMYNKKYRDTQRGSIGLAEIATWYIPASTSQADKAAAERYALFQIGWVLDPIFKGDYPQVMRHILGDRLPTFTEEEVHRLNNSVDFIGLNHYVVNWVTDEPYPVPLDQTSPSLDTLATASDSAPSNVPNAENLVSYSPACKFGLSKVIEWVASRYPNVDYYITENGYEDQVLPATKEEAIHDVPRIQYYEAYIGNLLEAIRNGAKVKGYFAWAFMDNFEWNNGYTARFGLYYVDRETLERYPKDSATWFMGFLKGTSTQ